MSTLRNTLPFCLPLLLTLVFVALVYSGYSGLFVLLTAAIAPLNRLWGPFSKAGLDETYRFFHYHKVMVIVKALSGTVLVLFNCWAWYFCFSTPLSFIQFLGLAYGLVVINGSFSLSLAHDLLHDPRVFHRLLGDILMIQNGFFYLQYDHIYIHHLHVGTADDPASAKLGESVYHYFRRSFSGRWRLIWRVPEGKEPAQKSRIRVYLRFKFALCLLMLIVAAGMSISLFSLVVLQFFFVILLYETTTYIQHYGLSRAFHHSRPEPVSLDHSWNSYDRLYNYLYFFMPVHSVHHAYLPDETGRDYFGPALPESFPRMLWMAFMPGRWFRVMNPLVSNIGTRRLQNTVAG